MSGVNQEILEDVIYCARYGELDDLKATNVGPEYLIEKNDLGNTPLHMASANNHADVVEYIIEQLKAWKPTEIKAFSNVQNAEGNTPLHWAALNGHLAVVKLLIKNKSEKTPIYEAQQHSHEKVAEFFLETMIEEEPSEPVDEDEQFVENGYQMNQ
ncbi:ankyrin repeat-containing domain protein [Dichotomocladium elegans]|nr:ankyrin repeat-containing domain protein [Dichotomocladium elegans]